VAARSDGPFFHTSETKRHSALDETEETHALVRRLPESRRATAADSAIPESPAFRRAFAVSNQQPHQNMAIKLIANYSKRLGLPGFSSHQFSVSVETELVTTDDIPGESGRLYQLLQNNVDEQILTTGFVPPADYGMAEPPPSLTGIVREENIQTCSWRRGPAWRCTEKQRLLILRLVDENLLDKNDVEALAKRRFGKGVRALHKAEASGLIDELIESYGSFHPVDGPHQLHDIGHDEGRRAR